MIIDAHTHIDLSSNDKLNWEGKKFKLKQSMHKNKIDKSIVFTSLPDIGNKCLSMKDLIKFLDKDTNFFVVGTIKITNNKHFKNDLKELDLYLRQKKIIAIKLYPGYEAFYPSDNCCNPIYDLCEKYNVPVIFHSGETFGEGVGIKYAMPIHIDDVAVKRPNLKIVIAHLGNPWINEVMCIINSNRNVYADISGLMYKDSSPYWVRHYSNAIVRLLRWQDGEESNRLLFGTDWSYNNEPSKIAVRMINLVKKLPISKEDKEKIFYKNAKKVFNI